MIWAIRQPALGVRRRYGRIGHRRGVSAVLCGQVVVHRWFWITINEKNTSSAGERSWRNRAGDVCMIREIRQAALGVWRRYGRIGHRRGVPAVLCGQVVVHRWFWNRHDNERHILRRRAQLAQLRISSPPPQRMTGLETVIFSGKANEKSALRDGAFGRKFRNAQNGRRHCQALHAGLGGAGERRHASFMGLRGLSEAAENCFADLRAYKTFFVKNRGHSERFLSRPARLTREKSGA